MARELTGLDIYYMMKEFELLKGCKIDRIFNSKEEKNIYVFVFHVPGKGKRFLNTKFPSSIYLAEEKQDFGTPTGLCMMLRKYLENSFLLDIKQKDMQRIIELKFDCRMDDEKKIFNVILELFSKGNLIFCASDGIILNLHEKQAWKDRLLENGQAYKYPSVSHNVLELSCENFSQIISGSDRDSVVKALAIDLGLSGVYSEEICYRAGVDKKTSCKNLKEKELKNLFEGFSELLKEKMTPNSVDGKQYPIEMQMLRTSEKKYYDTFSQAIIRTEAKIENTKEKEKILAIIAEQEKNLVECESMIVENKKKAELLYSNYQLIYEILNSLKDARKKYSWKEIKDKISKDPKYASVINKIDEADNSLVIDLDEGRS